MYDVTSRKSFEALENWYSDVKEKADKSAVICVAGNKMDLKYDQDVSIEDANVWCEVKQIFFLSKFLGKKIYFSLEREIDFCWN